MKKLFKVFYCVLLMSAFTIQSYAQNDFKITRKISLMDQKSKVQDVKFNIEEKIVALDFYISCSLGAGIVKIEIYDPKNQKQGNFVVEGDNDGEFTDDEKKMFMIGLEGVKGEIKREFSTPELGDWIVKITSEKAFGNIEINTRQTYVTKTK